MSVISKEEAEQMLGIPKKSPIKDIFYLIVSLIFASAVTCTLIKWIIWSWFVW